MPPEVADGKATPSLRSLHAAGGSAHLTLALALVWSAMDEASDAMHAAPEEEGLGLGFNRILDGALAHADGPSLIASAASRFQISSRQLHFLRASMAGEPRAQEVGRLQLSGVQTAALWLMRRSESLPLRLLKETLCLAPTPLPPPTAAALASRVGGYHYPKLVSTCALTFAAVCVWLCRAAVGGPSRCVAFS